MKSWHALLAPLPAGATVKRQPVVSAEIAATPHGASVADWRTLTVELSDPGAGLRHAMVVVDGAGQPIAASDTVYYRVSEREFRQESLGGRLEPDGRFLGTRWRTSGVETEIEDQPKMDPARAEPTAEEIAGLKALVGEILRRAP